jgi:tetratricopeptide (TPR) repeat protein
MKPLVFGAWSIFLGAALLPFAGPAFSQTVGISRTKIPQDPAVIELNRLLTAAQDAVNKQDYASAAQDYQAYLAKKPEDAVVHYDLGYAYTALQKPADAKREYEKAIALDPKMASAYQNLGVTLIPTDPAAAIEPLDRARSHEKGRAGHRTISGRRKVGYEERGDSQFAGICAAEERARERRRGCISRGAGSAAHRRGGRSGAQGIAAGAAREEKERRSGDGDGCLSRGAFERSCHAARARIPAS